MVVDFIYDLGSSLSFRSKHERGISLQSTTILMIPNTVVAACSTSCKSESTSRCRHNYSTPFIDTHDERDLRDLIDSFDSIHSLVPRGVEGHFDGRI